MSRSRGNYGNFDHAIKSAGHNLTASGFAKQSGKPFLDSIKGKAAQSGLRLNRATTSMTKPRRYQVSKTPRVRINPVWGDTARRTTGAGKGYQHKGTWDESKHPRRADGKFA